MSSSFDFYENESNDFLQTYATPKKSNDSLLRCYYGMIMVFSSLVIALGSGQHVLYSDLEEETITDTDKFFHIFGLVMIGVGVFMILLTFYAIVTKTGFSHIGRKLQAKAVNKIFGKGLRHKQLEHEITDPELHSYLNSNFK